MSSKQVSWKPSYNKIFDREINDLKNTIDDLKKTGNLDFEKKIDMENISNNFKILINNIFSDINKMKLPSSKANYDNLLDMMESINDIKFINDKLFDSETKNILILAGLFYIKPKIYEYINTEDTNPGEVDIDPKYLDYNIIASHGSRTLSSGSIPAEINKKRIIVPKNNYFFTLVETGKTLDIDVGDFLISGINYIKTNQIDYFPILIGNLKLHKLLDDKAEHLEKCEHNIISNAFYVLFNRMNSNTEDANNRLYIDLFGKNINLYHIFIYLITMVYRKPNIPINPSLFLQILSDRIDPDFATKFDDNIYKRIDKYCRQVSRTDYKNIIITNIIKIRSFIKQQSMDNIFEYIKFILKYHISSYIPNEKIPDFDFDFIGYINKKAFMNQGIWKISNDKINTYNYLPTIRKYDYLKHNECTRLTEIINERDLIYNHSNSKSTTFVMRDIFLIKKNCNLDKGIFFLLTCNAIFTLDHTGNELMKDPVELELARQTSYDIQYQKKYLKYKIKYHALRNRVILKLNH